MKRLLGLFIILIIVFTSCEGRKTQYQALTEDIEEFNKKVTIELDVYEPKSYVEREVDTLLSNGYHIKIRTYTDMENSVRFTKVKDTINYQTHYRYNKYDILVEKNNKVIYKESFDKDRANTLLNFKPHSTSDSPLHNFNELAVLKSIQINNNELSNTNIVIDVMYEIPNTNKRSLHQLIIDDTGQINVVYIK
ncbi:hypothetical protein [Winogradskyella flava]|uniref:hypothetical protein n=1 Tax=Winogradskyella flava TaxID=1884876 RepID=UPI002490EC67|nr:hypothetical protein [Winogradskyella flava]